MKKTNRARVAILWLSVTAAMLACSVTTPAAPTTEPEYRYDDLPGGGQFSLALSEYRAISKWDTLDISYYFQNGTEQLQGTIEHDLVRRAFAMWSNQTSLTFTEASSSASADILVAWARGDHGDGDPFDGPGDILAHASFPNPYDNDAVILHFDDDERWLDSETRNVDLLTVAAHEIGHTLGLAHSNDPDALMYPSYSGPRRFLGADDIAGVQALYGVASAPQPAPQAPPAGATPPPSSGTDSDGDGISDDEEVLVTGTDPNNADSDRDGLVDGVEVSNSMNPLDPDMDRDGVSDGDEVARGTDPFFPEQAEIPAGLEEDVGAFLTEAIELQMEAYRNGDPSIAASIMTGPILDDLTAEINSLNQQGLVALSEIDYYESYINDIRVLNDRRIEVDTCEVWTTHTYRLSDGQWIDTQGPSLLPQTVTIELLNGSWFISTVEFFSAPAFCS